MERFAGNAGKESGVQVDVIVGFWGILRVLAGVFVVIAGAVRVVDFGGFVGVEDVTGILAVALAFILTMNAGLVGVFGVFDFALLLVSQTGQFSGVLESFVSFGVFLAGGFG